MQGNRGKFCNPSILIEHLHCHRQNRIRLEEQPLDLTDRLEGLRLDEGFFGGRSFEEGWDQAFVVDSVQWKFLIGLLE